MWGKDKVLSFLHDVISKIPYDRKEVGIIINSEELTRFANNIIHQNVAEENLSLFVRVGKGKKKVILTTSSIGDERIRELINSIDELLDSQPETEELFLPMPEYVPEYKTDIFTPSPEERGSIVKKFIEKGVKHSIDTFGAVSENISEIGVVNSLGVESYGVITYAHEKVMYIGEGSGYQEEIGRDLRSINSEVISERALQKCLDSKNPIDLEPGIYTVILEPLAVGEMLEQLGYFGFSAKAVQEKRSFISLYAGQKVFNDNITIYDDGLDPNGIIVPIDFEGVPKRRVDLIKNGVVIGPVYDTNTAVKDGKKSTGHALPPPSWGPMPLNLFFVPGDKKVEDMIQNTEKGILVTRFHYVNAFLDPVRVLATGMTRDGTFLIENGKISKPIKNLRFTQSFLDVLSNTIEISRETLLVPCLWFARVPTIKVENFNFTGKTEF